jgi:hypothetical protein
MPTHPDLLRAGRALDAASAHLARLAAHTPEARWAQRRDPAVWSVAECVAHLVLTTDAYIPLVEAAIASAIPTPPPSRYRCDLTGWLIAKVAGPLPRIAGARRGGVRTQAAFVPGGEWSKPEALARFAAGQQRLHALLDEGERVRFDRLRVRSPFEPYPHYSVYAVFVIIPRHQERHLLQADDLWGTT